MEINFDILVMLFYDKVSIYYADIKIHFYIIYFSFLYFCNRSVIKWFLIISEYETFGSRVDFMSPRV